MPARFGFPIIGIGASAGGVEALKALFQALPADLDAALVVVTHIGPNHTSVLPAILQDCCHLPVLAIEGRPGAGAGPGLCADDQWQPDHRGGPAPRQAACRAGAARAAADRRLPGLAR